MYTSETPFHVVDSRRKLLIAGIVFTFLSAALIPSILIYLPSLVLSRGGFFALSFPPLFAVLSILGYFKGRRVEFYNDFVRVIGRGSSVNTDIKYSDVQLSPLMGTGRGAYSFKFWPKTSSEKTGWRVSNVRIHALNTTLYSTIQERSVKAELSNTSQSSLPSSLASQTSSMKRLPLLMALAGILLVVGGIFEILTPFGFWLLLPGILLLVFTPRVMGMLKAKETGH